jgi:hypothetical protein
MTPQSQISETETGSEYRRQFDHLRSCLCPSAEDNELAGQPAGKIRGVEEARVNIDHPVACDGRPYSVPHSLVYELIRPGAKE